MAEMRITPEQYEASMRRHGTREWTNEDNRVTAQYREENNLGEFAPEPERQIDADSQRSPDQRPERDKADDKADDKSAAKPAKATTTARRGAGDEHDGADDFGGKRK